jgi:hypothetical protein
MRTSGWLLLALVVAAIGAAVVLLRPKGPPPAEDVRVVADRVVGAFKAHDGAALAGLVHPEKGVRFSSSAFVDPAADQVFTPGAMAGFWADRTPRVWGTADGSGDPITLTPAAYAARFVMDRDYAAAVVSIDADRVRGTTIDNAAAVYPGSRRVEYFIAGTGADAAFDWSALRLVLERSGGRWWLVGVIHDQWTP